MILKIDGVNVKVKKDAVIYSSTDYQKFGKIEFNRDVKKAHLREIVETLDEFGQLEPARVNSKLKVLNGQNRLAAAAKLGIPFRFFIQDGDGYDTIAPGNTGQKNMIPKEYLNIHKSELTTKGDSATYRYYADLMEHYNKTLHGKQVLNFNELTFIVMNQNAHTAKNTKIFDKGELSIVRPKSETKEILDWILDELPVAGVSVYTVKKRELQRSLIHLRYDCRDTFEMGIFNKMISNRRKLMKMNSPNFLRLNQQEMTKTLIRMYNSETVNANQRIKQLRKSKPTKKAVVA